MHDMIESLARLSLLPEEAARMAAPIVERVVKANVQAGKTPQGVPWLAKKDGSQALVHAADHLKVIAQGTVIRIQLDGVDVIHNYGTRLGSARQEQLAASSEHFAKKVQSLAKRQDAKKLGVMAQVKASLGLNVAGARAARSNAQIAGQYHTPPRQIIPSNKDDLPESYATAIKQGADAAFLKLGGTT
jgi:hypothetical protein